MRQNEKLHSLARPPVRLSLAIVVLVIAVGSGLLLTAASSQASSQQLTERSQAAATGCSTYLSQATASTINPGDSATLAHSYPTTASNLESWLHNLDPAGAPATLMGAPAALQTLSPSANVSACVLQGNWVLPAGGGAGTNAEGFEVVVIAPDGTGTPVMWGPSVISTTAAPAIGNS